MDHFSIRDIENLCRIKAHTLRTWEQRYNLCVAKRKQSQHRVYSNEDLKELLRISYLYHNGHKISKIACLDAGQIKECIRSVCAQGASQEAQVLQLLEAGIDLDKESFEKAVNCQILRFGLEKCITQIFYPFLERIGLLWLTNHVIPAQEHFVSHIIRKKIILAIDGLGNTDNEGPITLVFAPEGEHHEIPLLAINYFLRKYQQRTIYLGTNTSLETIRYYLSHKQVDSLYAHLITHCHYASLEKFMKTLFSEYPDKRFMISGPASLNLRQEEENVRVFASPAELIQSLSWVEQQGS